MASSSREPGAAIPLTHIVVAIGLGRLLPQTSSPYAWSAHLEELQALELQQSV